MDETHAIALEAAPAQRAAATVKAWARDVGFDLVGIARPGAVAYAGAYRDWIASGRHGEMAYLARNIEERLDLTRRFPWAKSVVCVALSYWQESSEPRESEPQRSEPQESEPRLSGSGSPAAHAQALPDGRGSDGAEAPAPPGKIARYAWGRDYHRIVEHKLKKLEGRIRTAFSPQVPELQIRGYCDTGPLPERELAARAGLGWIGKHTLLIHPQHGSWFVLGELVLSLELAPDSPLPDHCGTCTRCIDACPTGAIVADAAAGRARSVDARRCISYLTLEHRGAIPSEFQPAMQEAGYVAGCDICQEVCPYNGAENPSRHPLAASEPDFFPRAPAPSIPLEQILAWQEADWDQLTRGRAFRRARLPMWHRTAAMLADR